MAKPWPAGADPSAHPYVRKQIGCHHGKLWSEPCLQCQIVGVDERIKRAERDIARLKPIRKELLRRIMAGER